MSVGPIQLRGVRVHNLKGVDLDIPRGRLVVLCGVSGSGKTSLALDTLYAEGQRRYIESFSAYTRQFLERLEKPDADRIDGIPPAVAVTRKSTAQSSRVTVGTATETIDYLRLLYAKIGQIVCQGCGRAIRRHSADTAAEQLSRLPEAARLMVAFERPVASDETVDDVARQLREDGFVRAVVAGRTVDLARDEPLQQLSPDGPLLVVVDRLKAGPASSGRLRESLEVAFGQGAGRCQVLVDSRAAARAKANDNGPVEPVQIDEHLWLPLRFSSSLNCPDCGRDYPEPEPRLYSFNSPLGACPRCEGFGNVIDIDMELVVPDPDKSIRDGAIAPWNTPAYRHELEELLALADDYGLPVDVPFRELTDEHVRLIRDGVPERDFGGLRGFFAWLERRKYKMHLRVFLSRWRSYRTCPECGGARLRPEALATQLGGKNIAELAQLKIDDALAFFQSLQLTPAQRHIARTMLDQVIARLSYLEAVGLGYLTLDRTLRTLSGGEAQRVALTSALGSSLVNMLYVLDEPSIGLHPRDVQRLVGAIKSLRDRGNTVVVVEHEEAMLRAADELVEVGPGAGRSGGKIVFQGTVDQMQRSAESLTGQYLSGKRGIAPPAQRRQPSRGCIRLAGARGHNLKNITVDFPLGLLCLVTGVSGSGKSSLVQDTLYPALRRRKRQNAPKPLPYDDVLGDGQIDDVVLVDQSPIARSARSNPVTYIKAFDEIRNVMADMVDARTHNYTAAHFSFNVDGGRCSKCKGVGQVAIDMQFLADVYMKCDQCQGRRYRREILEVTYRGKSIADILEMTVREAFSFFRGRPKVQAKLKRLIDVGLEYVPLGQPASTLSAGESQRLKLAAWLSTSSRNRTLFILDEPTTGLHYADITRLLDCFDALVNVGHSLIVVEHNLQLMRAADYIIDLGPGAADRGGEVVGCGTPEEIARLDGSATGSFLRQALAGHAADCQGVSGRASQSL